MLIRQKPPHKLSVFITFLLCASIVGYYSCIAEAQEEEEPIATTTSEDLSFPLLVLGGQAGAIVRNEAPGALLSVELTLNADWLHANMRATGGVLGNSSDGVLFSEFSGYAHLLAIGIGDVTYRHYMDGHEFRMLGGFSYTNSVEDIVRVDVNLGPAYFHSSQDAEIIDQFGLQIGTRVTVRFWHLQNTFYLAAFQTLRFGDAGIDLSDTTIVCENFAEVLTGADLICNFVEPDPDATGGGLVDWLHTGVIFHNRTFIWLHQEDDVQMGPELELRFEHMPLRGPHFWAMLSFRAQWATN